MNEEKELLKQLLKQVLENADIFTVEELIEITKIFKRAVELIEEQGMSQEQAPITEIAQPSNIPSSPYPSSNINGFQYDPQSGKLLVKFMGKDTADSGPTYSYEGVPEYIFDIFRRGAVGPKTTGKNKYHAWFKGKTPSHGAAMAALIKAGGFPYQRLS
jgi:hypothetical protein